MNFLQSVRLQVTQNKSQKNGKEGNTKFSHNDKTRNNMVQLRNRNRNSINLQILYFLKWHAYFNLSAIFYMDSSDASSQ